MMASKGNYSASSSPNLVCHLCLDIFEDATLLTCGHTFCRKCLKKYDAAHQDLDHMVCPLCRKTTKFSKSRVEDLPANTITRGLVDDYHGIHGGENAFLELRSNCTFCEMQENAIFFCSSCNTYMCDKCSLSHQQLSLLFKGHHVTSVEDIMSGKVSISQVTDKCEVHQHENKDLFCEQCKVHICLKCVIVKHRDHEIRNQRDFEEQLQQKVDELKQRCKMKKRCLEKNIQNIETRRQEVHSAIQKLQSYVSEAYIRKAEQLKQNEQTLIGEIQLLQKRFFDDLDTLKAKDRQKIKSITSTATLVANDRLGRLETDSLTAHTLLCEELDGLLKEATDKTSAADVSETARHKRFVPADDGLLDLGKVTSDVLLESDVGNPTKSFLHVVKGVDLPRSSYGIAKMSKDSVAVALFHNKRFDVISSTGKRKTLAGLPSRPYYDIAIQGNGNMVISLSSFTEIYLHAEDGSMLSTIQINQGRCIPRLSVTSSNEIVVANGKKEIYIYDPSGIVLKHTVSTEKNISRQAFVTKSDVIVSSSCDMTPSVLTVYDREGRVGSSLTANRDEFLYAAADDQDRIYVATVKRSSGTLSMTVYELDHLNLIEKYRLGKMKLCIKHSLCYLVSLSDSSLAFISNRKLYFLEVGM